MTSEALKYCRGEEPQPPTATRPYGLPCVTNEESHLGGCDRFSCDNEVALILAVLGVKDNDEFAILYSESQLVALDCRRNPIGRMVQKAGEPRGSLNYRTH